MSEQKKFVFSMDQLTSVAQSLTGLKSAKVYPAIDGYAAYKGAKISMPELDPIVDGTTLAVARSTLDVVCAKVRAKSEKWLGSPDVSSLPARAKSVAESLEDIRAEMLLEKKFPGTKGNIAASVTRHVNPMLEKKDDNKLTGGKVLDCMYRSCRGYPIPATKAYREAADMIGRHAPLIMKVLAKCKSSKNLAEAAGLIDGLIQAEFEKKKNEEKPPGTPQPPPGTGGIPGGGGGPGGDWVQLQPNNDPNQSHDQDRLDELLSQVMSDLASGVDSPWRDHGRGKVSRFSDVFKHGKLSRKLGKDCVKIIRSPDMGSLMKALDQRIHTRPVFSKFKKSGRIVGIRDLVRAITNKDEDVFCRQKNMPVIGSDIVLLQDFSGSMRGTNADMSASVCEAVTCAAHRYGHKVMVCGFGDPASGILTSSGSLDARITRNSRDFGCLFITKEFDDRYVRGDIYTKHKRCAWGGTPLSGPMAALEIELVRRGRGKNCKILIISDGQASHPAAVLDVAKGMRRRNEGMSIHLVMMVHPMRGDPSKWDVLEVTQRKLEINNYRVRYGFPAVACTVETMPRVVSKAISVM